MISWLRDYYEAGVYPTDEGGRPISVFKDARGVRCPMAELIARSGHEDLVDEIAAIDNKMRLADVKDGPVFDWMAESGLTIEEIAMVQGAMDIDYTWMRQQPNIEIQRQPNGEIILARGQVRGRLETAVTALGVNGAHSLGVAAKRLAQKPATSPRATRTVVATDKAPILQR
ncbi:MAG TPA: hypothetical protein VFV99_09925 [Kofleriaceae bacterium]|nr:hypothetical protein [Kofleriaceae bacterium]